MANAVYKNPEAKRVLMELYDKKLAACNIEFEDIYVDTYAGKTHVVATGPKDAPPFVILHGINAGAPLALEAIKGLNKKYRIYAIDTIGQATKSAENVLPIKDESYGKWMAETITELGLKAVPIVGVSYGGFLLQRLIMHAPQMVTKAIFVVPAGLVGGPFLRSMKELTFPLMRFMFSKSDKNLIKFISAFCSDMDEHTVLMQKTLLSGVNIDFRRPKLLQVKDIKGFESPVYAMVADNDIFFPDDKALERCKIIFKNFRESYILKNSKHIPALASYPEIERKIGEWLAK